MKKEIKQFEEVYKENENTPNEERKWYGEKCVRCMRKIVKPPYSVNIYEQIGVSGYKCGRKDCEIIKGSEAHKSIFWQLHFLEIILNPNYWMEGLVEKHWEELKEFACGGVPGVKNQMAKYDLPLIIKFIRMLND